MQQHAPRKATLKAVRALLRAALPLFVLMASSEAAASSTVTVSTGLGQIVGRQEGGLRVFRGIPYARPPVGPLRWRPPVPEPAWRGVAKATKFGAACPQSLRKPPPILTDGAVMRTSEDCLTLNIWGPTGRNLPVMVFIHGGAFVEGSGAEPIYDGAHFARAGVILVTLNYRLGPLGFFAHPSLTREAAAEAPLANYGIMDQREALRWVSKNIAAFGGDPNNITLFGQSAGAVSVLALLTMPDEHLFAHAILQSGGPWANGQTLAEASSDGEKIARQAGLPDNASAAALRALAVRSILGAEQRRLAGAPYPFAKGVISTRPIIDGRLVSQRLSTLVQSGHLIGVPIIVGFNSGEDSLLTGPGAAATFRSAFGAADATDVERLYRPDRPDRYGHLLAAQDTDRSLFQDAILGAPARWLARQALRSYFYYYDFVPGAVSQQQGAPHGGELATLFGNFQASDGLSKSDRQSREAFSKSLRQCWISFAKAGEPRCPPFGPWPSYGETDSLLYLGSPTRVMKSFRADRFDWLDNLRQKGLLQ